jgi:transcriptional regulator with XRE-family HTH domain
MPKLAPMTFADWVHLQRRRIGIRQEDVAEAVGISPQTVSAWETGRSIPKLNPRQMKVLCEQLNCDLEELVEAFGTEDLKTTT